MTGADIIAGYTECAIWSSTDEDGRPLDHFDASLTEDAETTMLADCEDFIDYCDRMGLDIDGARLSPEQVGADFWLTRNRHGAGFWDRDLGRLGEELTDAAHTFGEAHLYIDGEEIHHV